MQNWSSFISAGVSPIIVISACGLLCLAFYNRLTAVVTRLRGFQRERLEQRETLSHESPEDEPTGRLRHQEILAMLQLETELLKRRARLIRRTLACLLLAIIALTLCSLGLGLSSILAQALFVAVPCFVIGLGMLVAAAIFALIELRSALNPVEFESMIVSGIVEPP